MNKWILEDLAFTVEVIDGNYVGNRISPKE